MIWYIEIRRMSIKFKDLWQTEASDFSILSSSDIAQQPAGAASARWQVVERYLKNLIEKSPALVCLNLPILATILMLMDQVTFGLRRLHVHTVDTDVALTGNKIQD